MYYIAYAFDNVNAKMALKIHLITMDKDLFAY